MMLLPLVALSLLAQSASPSLPAGHPPLEAQGAPSQGSLPANHPPLAGSGPAAQGAPANHPPLVGVPDANELMGKLEQVKDLKERPKTFEVAVSLGKLYYGGARYTEAAEFLGQALQKAEPARKLFLEQIKKAKAAKKELPPPEGVGCAPSAEQQLDALVKTAQQKAAAGDSAAAAMCARVALIPVLEASMMRGKALFMSGDPKAATAEFSRVLEVSGDHSEARYARGNTLLDSQGNDPKALKLAREDLAAVAQSAQSPKAQQASRLVARVDEAIAAGGIARLNAKKAEERRANPVKVASAPHPPMNAPFANGAQSGAAPLTREQMEAVQNTERTPELEQGLGKLVDEAEEHLAKGRYQEALDNYKRVVPFQPENGRAKAGMAWALVSLNKQPMAERIWGVAVGSDARAVDGLGDMLKAKGDANGAKALWSKLAGSSPDYAKAANLQAKLK